MSWVALGFMLACATVAVARRLWRGVGTLKLLVGRDPEEISSGASIYPTPPPLHPDLEEFATPEHPDAPKIAEKRGRECSNCGADRWVGTDERPKCAACGSHPSPDHYPPGATVEDVPRMTGTTPATESNISGLGD